MNLCLFLDKPGHTLSFSDCCRDLQSAKSFGEILLSMFHISLEGWVMPGCFCTRAQRGDRRTQTKPGMDKRKRVILKTCRASVIFPFFLWLMEEGLPLSEGWANSNEAVCGTESCLAMAHSSEILQLPGCQKPSIVPGSPAGLRAMDHGAKTSSFSQMRSALTSSSPVSFPSSHQTFPLIKSCYFSGYRVMKHRVASSFFLTVHIHQGVISFSFT